MIVVVVVVVVVVFLFLEALLADTQIQISCV